MTTIAPLGKKKRISHCKKENGGQGTPQHFSIGSSIKERAYHSLPLNEFEVPAASYHDGKTKFCQSTSLDPKRNQKKYGYAALMEKSRRDFKQLKHNRNIPKQEAHQSRLPNLSTKEIISSFYDNSSAHHTNTPRLKRSNSNESPHLKNSSNDSARKTKKYSLKRSSLNESVHLKNNRNGYGSNESPHVKNSSNDSAQKTKKYFRKRSSQNESVHLKNNRNGSVQKPGVSYTAEKPKKPHTQNDTAMGSSHSIKNNNKTYDVSADNLFKMIVQKVTDEILKSHPILSAPCVEEFKKLLYSQSKTGSKVIRHPFQFKYLSDGNSESR